jgi:hypothetical protein|tara:strand:- start:289 stop:546 length:258 start_codon:yes stop_codon:yes gene_type:complete
MIGLNKWLFFENDLCEACGHCKVVKLTSCEMSIKLGHIQVIISCACDTAVFAKQWQSLAPAERIHCVGDMTVDGLLIMLGEMLGS